MFFITKNLLTIIITIILSIFIISFNFIVKLNLYFNINIKRIH